MDVWAAAFLATIANWAVTAGIEHTSHEEQKIGIRWAGFLLLCLTTTSATVPDPPRQQASTVNCKPDQLYGFSATTDGSNKKNTPLRYTRKLLERTTGYNSENGIFTSQCPGIFHVSFSGSGENLQLSLRRRPSSVTAAWSEVVGGGGGSVLLSLQPGEQLAVFWDAGSLAASQSHSFTIYRVHPN